MKNFYSKVISIAILFVLVIVCITIVIINNNESKMCIPLQISFSGEYSVDGVNWKELNDESKISVKNNQLILKGHFNQNIEENSVINYYSNHVGLEVYINGQLVFMDILKEIEKIGIDIQPSMCGKGWKKFLVNGITTDDEIEFHFINYHKYGNESAYMDFLNNIYATPNVDVILEDYLKDYTMPYNIVGSAILIISLIFLGIAVGIKMENKNATASNIHFGFFALFSSLYIIFDTMFFFSLDELLVLKTYGRQLSLMLAGYFFVLLLKDILKPKERKITSYALTLLYLFNVLALIFVITGKLLIFDIYIYWIIVQLIISFCLFIMIAKEYRKLKRSDKFLSINLFVLLCCGLLDIFNVNSSILFQGFYYKLAFTITFFIYIILGIKKVVINYNAIEKNEKLKKELEETRIAIMFSQLQPHFLHNVLSAITELCDRNPKQAKNSIIEFSDYLRGNLSVTKLNEIIPFKKELEHIRKYLNLEKLRFGKELSIEYDIETEDFYVPVLSVQLLVENAVKHGVGPKMGGWKDYYSYITG